MNKTAGHKSLLGRFRSYSPDVLFKNALDAMFLVDDGAHLVDANRAAYKLLGFKRHELLRLTIWDVVGIENAEAGDALWREFMAAGPWSGECRLRRKDGGILEAECRAVFNVVRGLHLCFIHDVTEHKEAERRVHERARQLAALADLGRIALAGASSQQLMRQIVRTVAATLNIEYCQVLKMMDSGRLLLIEGVGWKEGLVGQAEVRPGVGSQAGYTLQSNKPVVVEDFRRETRFRAPPLLSSHGVASGMSCILRSPDGVFGVLGAHSSLPRRFSADDACFLQSAASLITLTMARERGDEENRFQASLLRQVRNAVVATDLGLRITYWNKHSEAIYGRSDREVMGKNAIDVLFPKQGRVFARELFGSRRSHWEAEVVFYRKGGRTFPGCLIRAPFRDRGEGVTGVILVAFDLTKLHEAERKLRDLSARLVRVQDEERRRIARELHDSIAQSLASLNLNLAVTGECESALNRRSRAALSEGRALADQCLHEVRTFSYLLHPPILDELGLSTAVAWYVDGFSARSGIRVDLKLDPGLRRMSQDVETTIFRIVQESLTNVHRHSRSSQCAIRICRNKTCINLEVRDQGIGMMAHLQPSEDRTEPRLGVGIAGMRERVRQLGGHLEIKTRTRGVCVRASIPIEGGARA